MKQGSVRLTSALQRASSVICYGAGIPPVTRRGIFFDSPFVCTACIRFISSLRTVHTLSVCLTSSPRPNDYFIAFFVFTARIGILFQQGEDVCLCNHLRCERHKNKMVHRTSKTCRVLK